MRARLTRPTGRLVAVLAVLVLLCGIAAGADALVRTGGSGSSRVPVAAGRATPATASPGPSASVTHVPAPVSSTSGAVAKVPALRRLTPADLVVTVSRAASTRGLHRLAEHQGVSAVAALDRGVVTIKGLRVATVGVPLSSIRGFTPALTAKSKALWRSVASGEITLAYSDHHQLHHLLGHTVSDTHAPGSTTQKVRVGALATLGISDARALIASTRSGDLGLKPRREVLIAAPKLSLDALTVLVHHDLGSSAHVTITRAVPVDQSVASSYALSRIPASYLDLYRRAAVTCQGLPWTVLGAIGTVETGNGSNVHRSTAGAEGPMQFLPSTWARYGVDADGDGKADIDDPVDAVFAAARYLCAAGAGHGQQSINDAIYSYNHAWWYVREVIDLANAYA